MVLVDRMHLMLFMDDVARFINSDGRKHKTMFVVS
jgi:hypothetical protein